MSQTNNADSDGCYQGQSSRRRFGWFFSEDSELVWNPGQNGSGPLIQTEEGEREERYIQRFRDQVARGRGGLWGRLAPVEIDGIEIRQNTKLWHDGREAWLRAVEIDVSDDPEPIIRFKIDGSWPAEYVEYFGTDLEELREEGVIESQKEVNDRAEELLEEFRSSEE